MPLILCDRMSGKSEPVLRLTRTVDPPGVDYTGYGEMMFLDYNLSRTKYR